MTELIERFFNFANGQSKSVQWLIVSLMLCIAANQSLSVGESLGKALFRILH